MPPGAREGVWRGEEFIGTADWKVSALPKGAVCQGFVLSQFLGISPDLDFYGECVKVLMVGSILF